MIKEERIIKRRARVARLGRQAAADGYFNKVMQSHHFLRQIDEQLLSLSQQKPFTWSMFNTRPA
jgi:hypothetical protein